MFYWIIFLTIVFGLFVLWLIVYLLWFRPLRPKEDGFLTVFVEDDGKVRELYDDEEKYVTEKFKPGDGNRPYYKSNYHSKTPDGSMSGFMVRRRVPKNIDIIKKSDLPYKS